ncbi:MAG TPA: hypothetical protein VE978_06950 [Chitinophagales bacterium]|nr:hypothetical protein [Chitinophagales bacterium]
MKKRMRDLFCLCAMSFLVMACPKAQSPPPVVDTGLVNTSHLDYLYTPVIFPSGTHAAGVYIYCDAPNYNLVEAAGEGFTCVDDVARAALVYLRSSKFSTDTAVQAKTFNLIRFILEMQSANGYFYNFLFTNGTINNIGSTSINNPNWWSWRALQTLTEAEPVIKNMDAQLYDKMDVAVNKLVAQIKTDLVNLPQTTKVVNGITVPEWLPSVSATDQAALLILGLIPYCLTTNDAVIKDYIKKLADGIVVMQVGDVTHFPYGCFLSWENTWHAYGNTQAFALMQAGTFLNDPQYTTKAMIEVDNFYPWLLQNGIKSSFSLSQNGNTFQTLTDNNYAQIAYGIEPMVFAAVEAYKETGQDKYADIAGHLAAWFLGANDAGVNMYDVHTGRCYDGITSSSAVNYNSGAESTIEALLTLERVEAYPAVKEALDKY